MKSFSGALNAGRNHFPRVLCTNRLWAGFLGFKGRYRVGKELAPEELLDA